MKIIFNPDSPDGADIKDFNHNGNRLDPHPVYSLKQYSDSDAAALLETFPFLRQVSEDEAKVILKQQEDQRAQNPEKFECEFCGEKFTTSEALQNHLKTHEDEVALKEKPVIDPNLIPIAKPRKQKVKKADSNSENIVNDPTLNIPNGKDKDGVEWYGEGYQEDQQSFAPETPVGEKGHF